MECSGGLRGLKYGITRDYVMGMEAVLMGGRTFRVGGKLTKDVAGYDLVRLLVGSEGTLAVLTEITLKLLPAPEAKATGAAYFRDLEASARSVSRIIEKRILPATLEFLDQATMRVVDESAGLGLPEDAGAMLIFGQDGAAPVVERDTAMMAEICREEGAISVEVAADEDAAGKLLAARRGAIPGARAPRADADPGGRDGAALRARRHGARGAEDRRGGGPPDRGLRARRRRQPASDLLHRRPRSRPGRARAPRVRPHLRRRARARRARSPGEHGIGVTKLQYLEKRLGPVGIDLLRGIKKRVRPARAAQPGQGGAVTAAPDLAAPGRGLFPDDLLRTCISCGFCLSACPTYQDTRNEASSPRGRINLMRALEAGTLVEDDVREELSFCLGCRACEPVCPAGVKYGALLEHGRDAVGPARDPKLRGLLLAVGSPRRTRLAGRMMRMGQLLGLHRLAPSRALRAAGKAAPRGGARRRPGACAARSARRPASPAALFLGCVGHVMFSGAVARGLRHARDGGLPRHDAARAGLLRRAARAQRRSRRRARAGATGRCARSPAATGPIVTTAGGCGAFMADYGLLLGTPEAEAFGARVRDYSTLLAGRDAADARTAAPLRVAYQDSCHLRNGQKVTLEPRALLASLPGVEVVDLPSAGRCCGAAGTYALMRPDDSLRFLDAKLGEIAEAGVDAIVSGNPGCLLQFRQGVQRADLRRRARAAHGRARRRAAAAIDGGAPGTLPE